MKGLSEKNPEPTIALQRDKVTELILLLDKQNLLRETLAFWLREKEKLDVVSTEDIQELAREVKNRYAYKYRIVIANKEFERSLENIREIFSQAPHQTHDYKISIITDSLDHRRLVKALMAGVSGLIYIEDSIDVLRKMLINFSQRTCYLSPSIKTAIGNIPPKELYSLTPAEKRVALLILQGNSVSQIARALKLSSRTIENQRKSIKEKLGVTGGKLQLNQYLGRYACTLLNVVNIV